MTRTIITALFICTTICSFGQKGIGIKIYQNTDIFEIQFLESVTHNVEKFDKVNFSRVSLALDIDTKKGYTHEIEFLIPEVSKSYDNVQYPMNYEFEKKDAGFEGRASSYALRYELSKTLTSNTKKFCFDLGIGMNPYYVHIEYIPNVPNSYYSSTKLYGFVLNIVPRVKYKLSQRFTIDLNVPLKIYDLQAEKYRVANPAIPIHQQTTIDYRNIFFESAYTFRVGLMYKFSK
jgi:hypothetical protein